MRMVCSGTALSVSKWNTLRALGSDMFESTIVYESLQCATSFVILQEFWVDMPELSWVVFNPWTGWGCSA